jgi:hypothetical protein
MVELAEVRGLRASGCGDRGTTAGDLNEPLCIASAAALVGRSGTAHLDGAPRGRPDLLDE